MTLLFFHGTEILAFFAGLGLGAVGMVSLLIWLFVRPPRIPIVPAVIYSIAATISCVALFVEPANTETALDRGYLLTPPTAFCFPWSFLVILIASFAIADVGKGWFLVSVAINAFPIYGIGRVARGRAEHEAKC